MVASRNGYNQYSIRERYTKKLESWEILKQCEQRFLKSKTTKKEINGSKDIKDTPSRSYSKTKNQTTIMIRNNLSHLLCQYLENSF